MITCQGMSRRAVERKKGRKIRRKKKKPSDYCRKKEKKRI
jgi:hypothetical protein